MTEDEAKTKACCGPEGTGRVNDNSLSMEVKQRLCTASACMAWRGSETAEFKARANAAYQREGARITPKPSDIEGYRGLAGPPA